MTSRLGAVLGSLVFLVLAPGVVAGLVPYWISGWRFERPAPAWILAQVAGTLLAAAGALVLVDSFARFALQGLGTPAPVLPTRTLVVTGWYRHVRNPMYVAVTALVLGQALLFGSRGLLRYAAALALAFHVFVRLYEEPTLRERHGEEYERYCAAVGRWLPRLRPWSGS